MRIARTDTRRTVRRKGRCTIPGSGQNVNGPESRLQARIEVSSYLTKPPVKLLRVREPEPIAETVPEAFRGTGTSLFRALRQRPRHVTEAEFLPVSGFGER
jgi:hypothetical protein